jgi:hypothetical protein
MSTEELADLRLVSLALSHSHRLIVELARAPVATLISTLLRSRKRHLGQRCAFPVSEAIERRHQVDGISRAARATSTRP